MSSGYGMTSATGYVTSSSAYPVDVAFPSTEGRNKLYAIPVVGLLVREILLIPHLIILYVLNIVVAISQLVLWIPVLFTGRYPNWGHTLVGGTLSWSTRVSAYLLGLSDQYPAFSLQDPGGIGESHMLLQPSPTANRLYAIPVVGYAVKYIMLIPHMIALAVVGVIALVVALLAWIPVLMTGQYPAWGVKWVGGAVRWGTRIYAFWYGLTDTYPPFSLD